MIHVEEVSIDTKKIRTSYLMLKTLALPVPKKIMSILTSYPEGRNVTHLYVALRLEQCVVSHHLASLRRYDLVITTRKGKEIFYQVNEHKMAQICNALDRFFGRDSFVKWESTVV